MTSSVLSDGNTMAHALIRFINVQLMRKGNLRCWTTLESTRICLAMKQSLQLLGCNMSSVGKLYHLSVTLNAMNKLLLQISWASDTSVITTLDISCPESCLSPRHILTKSTIIFVWSQMVILLLLWALHWNTTILSTQPEGFDRNIVP